MDKDKIEIVSDSIQKEFEQNPLKIIELIRKEKEKEKSLSIENEKTIEQENQNNNPISIKIFSENNKEEKKDNLINTKFDNSLDNNNNEDININKNINNINIIHNNLIINNNISNNNIIIANNNNKNYYLDKEDFKINNDNISNESNKKYLGNIVKPNNNNIFISFTSCKYVLLNNVNILLRQLNSNKGSILAQKLLDEIDNKEIDNFFNIIIPYISEIMCLEYGNYFIQKLFKKLNIQQRLKIYQIIEPHFLEIATNKSGTHSIQSLMDCINTPIELIYLNKLLNKNMLLLFLDENGYHIIMKIILDIPEYKRNNLNLFLILNLDKIIINYNGSFCVNKFVNKNNDLKLRALLIQKIQNNIYNFITNKYSCKILFLILEKFGINCGLFILKYIQNNFAILSIHPISMNFIIKTLNYLHTYSSFELGILIWSVYKNNILLKYLLSNENGTKLLKLMIDLSDEEQKTYIFLKINII